MKENFLNSKKKILMAVIAGIFLTSASVVAVLTFKYYTLLQKSFDEQQKTLTAFAIDNIEIGLSNGFTDFIMKTLNRVSEHSIFAGAIVYDEEMTPILVKPKGFELSPEIKEEILKRKEITHGDVYYLSTVL